MKLISSRSMVVKVLSLLIVIGLLLFSYRYVKNASWWAQYPANKHYYNNGHLISSGKIYDRSNNILYEVVDGKTYFNESKRVRTAVMHTTGDLYGNVATGAQVAFGDFLTGWDLLNGAFAHDKDGGNDLKLTIDSNLSAEAYELLNGRKGAVGVYNYKTGEIITMASSPSFDPQNSVNIEENPEMYEGVYINRFLSASFTPGSVFKLITAAAAIDNIDDIESKAFHCSGEYNINGDVVTCLSAHGDIDFKDALAVSCNCAFAEISLELGGAALQEYAEKVGFNSSLKVDGIETAKSVINARNAVGADLAWAGIGQYTDLVNPLNFMAYVGAIANDGVMVYPKIIKNNNFPSFMKHCLAGDEKRILPHDTAVKLKSMMRNNVQAVYGEKKYEGLNLAAKSGTAEVGEGKVPHSWFVGFMDREDCPLAFVVVIENGGIGSRAAGSVAGKVLRSAMEAMKLEQQP